MKMEDSSRNDREVVLTLSPRVTAKEIMQLLSVNQQWKISGNMLRIPDTTLAQKAKGKTWLEELTDEVAALEKKKDKKKEEVALETK